MDTRNRVSEPVLDGLTFPPAAPGMLLLAGLLAVTISGWTVTSADWFWPACAALAVLTVILSTVRHEMWRRARSRQHAQRMHMANAILNDRLAFVEPVDEIDNSLDFVQPIDEIGRSIREIGDLVERFGHKLDDLLTEVHTEKSSAVPRPRRS
jgi:hypothetical protein